MKRTLIGVTAIFALSFGAHYLHHAKAQGMRPDYHREPKVLIGLAKSQSLTLSFSQDYTLDGGQGPVNVPAHGQVKLEAGADKILVTLSAGNKILCQTEVTSKTWISPCPESDTAYFTVLDENRCEPSLLGRKFRETAVIMIDDSSLVAANLVGIEKYLWSVVSSEMPAGWAKEVLRSQAVVSRTYTLHQGALYNDALDDTLGLGSLRLWADESDQVYRGMGYEDVRTVEACRDTQGLVLSYQNSPIAAYFHADAAGITENPRFVWGGNVPHLSSVAEIPHESPHSSWEVSFNVETLTEKLKAYFKGSEIDMVSGREPGASGRWFSLSLGSRGGDGVIKGTDLRKVLDLKSTWFSVFRKGGGAETLGCLNLGHEVCVDNGSRVHALPLSQCQVVQPQSRSGPVTQTMVVAPQERCPLQFLFSGRGWGHGVGFSQWGAKAMAEEGADHRDILMRYYPGTSMETWW